MSGDHWGHGVFLRERPDVIDAHGADPIEFLFERNPFRLRHEESAEPLHPTCGQFAMQCDPRCGLGTNTFKIVFADGVDQEIDLLSDEGFDLIRSVGVADAPGEELPCSITAFVLGLRGFSSTRFRSETSRVWIHRHFRESMPSGRRHDDAHPEREAPVQA